MFIFAKYFLIVFAFGMQIYRPQYSEMNLRKNRKQYE